MTNQNPIKCPACGNKRIKCGFIIAGARGAKVKRQQYVCMNSNCKQYGVRVTN